MLPTKAAVLLLWLGAVPVQPSVRRKFWYVSRPATWEDARELCRRDYDGDLATLVGGADLQNVDLRRFGAWFGLKKVGSSWLWVDDDYALLSQSGTTQLANMNTFINGQPKDGEECGKVIYYKYRAYSDDCDRKLFVFCESPSYEFVPETKTWAEGLQYCLSHNWKYMTFSGNNPNDIFSSVYKTRDFPVWIGLRHDGGAWNWSDGAHSDYRDWDTGSDPGPSPGPGSCVAVSSVSQSMSVRSCSEAFPYVCYSLNLVLLAELVTWEEALEACRTLSSSGSHRLLSLKETELVYALNHARRATTSKVWVGLRFLAGSWFWSDGFPLTLPTPPSCSDSALRCGALVVNSSSIEASDCRLKLNALCYRET